MVSPISHSDESESFIGPELPISEFRSQSFSIIRQSSSDSGEESSGAFDVFSRLSEAKTDLGSLLDRLAEVSFIRKASTPSTGGTTGAPETGGTEPTGPTQEELQKKFDAAVQAANDAFTAFGKANTAQDAQTQLSTLQSKLKEAEELSQQIDPPNGNAAKIEALKQNVKNASAMMQCINDMNALATKTEELLKQVNTTGSIDVANNAVVDASLNSTKAVKILEDAKKIEGFASSPPPALANDKAKVDKAATQISTFSEKVQAAADAVKQAEQLLKEAQMNGSPAKIKTCLEEAAKLKEQVNKLISEAGTPTPPFLNDSLKRIENVISSLETLEGQFDEVTSGIVTGSTSSSVGTSQKKNITIGEARIGFLLNDSDSQTASIIMDGFRKMIDLFHQENPDIRPTLRGVVDSLDAVYQQKAQDPAFAALEQSGALSAMSAAATASGDALAAAMGAIAQATAAIGGANPIQAAQVGSGVAGISSAGYSKKASALTDGYDAVSKLGESYTSMSPDARRIVDSTASRSLQRPLMDNNARKNAEQTLSRSNDRNSRMTRDMLRYTDNVGTLYGALGAYESLAKTISANPNANLEEIKQKLTVEVTKAPKYSYPYMQLPKEGAQKFIQNLTKEFVEGTKQDLEKSINEFRIQPMFVQQFLINVASLLGLQD